MSWTLLKLWCHFSPTQWLSPMISQSSSCLQRFELQFEFGSGMLICLNTKSRLFEDQPKLPSLQVCKVRVTSVLELELAEWIEHNVATLFYWYESSMICFFSEKNIWHEIWQTFPNMINFKINLILLFYTNIHFILDIIVKLILPQKSLFSKMCLNFDGLNQIQQNKIT